MINKFENLQKDLKTYPDSDSSMISQNQSKVLLLRAEIDEVKNQILHLERSQVELKTALEDVEDEDFRLALIENEQTIRVKKEKVENLIKTLRSMDIAFQNEYVSEQGLQSRVTNNSNSSVTENVITVVTNNNNSTSDGLFL